MARLNLRNSAAWILFDAGITVFLFLNFFYFSLATAPTPAVVYFSASTTQVKNCSFSAQTQAVNNLQAEVYSVQVNNNVQESHTTPEHQTIITDITTSESVLNTVDVSRISAKNNLFYKYRNLRL